MGEEELMLKSAIYAVEHLLLQGYRTYYTKENGETYRTDYTNTMNYLKDKLSELKGENPDCRNCDKWKTCENGEKGHTNGTSIGYSIGECRDYVELKGE